MEKSVVVLFGFFLLFLIKEEKDRSKNNLNPLKTSYRTKKCI